VAGVAVPAGDLPRELSVWGRAAGRLGVVVAGALPRRRVWQLRLAATPARMSRAGPAAALALKTQSKLSAADNDLAATAAAGQALNAAAAAAAAAAPAAAAAAPARAPAYDFHAIRIASASLPAQPAAVSSAGRRASQPLAAFQGDFQPQGPQGAQGRGRPSDGTGAYKCEVCGKRFKQKGSITNYHMKEWDVVGADGMVTKERLCRTRDSAKIQLLEARGKAAQQQSGQWIASFLSPAAGSGASSLTHILCHFCWISASFSIN